MLATLSGALFLLLPLAQQQDPTPPSHRMEITLEQKIGDQWKVVDPATVFPSGAMLRFRFRSNFAGFLYVMNQGTSGSYTMLFPRADTGTENRVEPNKEYGVPATNGYFRLSGPPGYDILYWMVTPMQMAGGQPQRFSGYVPLPPPPPPGTKLDTLIPRCDDSIFKARGECIDAGAGPKKVQRNDALPKNLQSVPDLQSRDLIFIKDQESAVVSAPPNLRGPVIYEFRLAHK